MSRTQVLLAKIHQTCQDIRDIKKTRTLSNQSQINRLIQDKKHKGKYMEINTSMELYSHNPGTTGTYAKGMKDYRHSNHRSTIYQNDLDCNGNIPQKHEVFPTHKRSFPTPLPPKRLHGPPPDPVESSESDSLPTSSCLGEDLIVSPSVPWTSAEWYSSLSSDTASSEGTLDSEEESSSPDGSSNLDHRQ